MVQADRHEDSVVGAVVHYRPGLALGFRRCLFHRRGAGSLRPGEHKRTSGRNRTTCQGTASAVPNSRAENRL